MGWRNRTRPVIRIVLNGLTGELKFNGQIYNGTDGPWKDVLNDEEVADVLTFCSSEQGVGNNAPAVAPERVAQVREKIQGSSPFHHAR